MEKLLLKLARQLDSLDEASLTALWGKYATRVGRFEPTRAWEESALVFSLIQAKRWKNQLFNFQWARQARPPDENAPLPPLPDFPLELTNRETAAEPSRCRVLPFTPLPAKPKEANQPPLT